jgi:predicted nucleic acid-binding protein
VDAELRFLEDLAEGTYIMDALALPDLAISRDVAARYRDLELGLADASLVVLANRWATRRIITLDERAFRTVEPLQGGSFTVLPADAE